IESYEEEREQVQKDVTPSLRKADEIICVTLEDCDRKVLKVPLPLKGADAAKAQKDFAAARLALIKAADGLEPLRQKVPKDGEFKNQTVSKAVETARKYVETAQEGFRDFASSLEAPAQWNSAAQQKQRAMAKYLVQLRSKCQQSPVVNWGGL